MKEIKDISDINTAIPEGKLALGLLIMLTGLYSKLSKDVIEQANNRAEKELEKRSKLSEVV